jgi:hypothetical protein
MHASSPRSAGCRPSPKQEAVNCFQAIGSRIAQQRFALLPLYPVPPRARGPQQMARPSLPSPVGLGYHALDCLDLALQIMAGVPLNTEAMTSERDHNNSESGHAGASPSLAPAAFSQRGRSHSARLSFMRMVLRIGSSYSYSRLPAASSTSATNMRTRTHSAGKMAYTTRTQRARKMAYTMRTQGKYAAEP